MLSLKKKKVCKEIVWDVTITRKRRNQIKRKERKKNGKITTTANATIRNV